MALLMLDCKGLPCPQPVLKTKEALEQGDDQIVVIVDNEASRNNVLRFAESRGCVVMATPLDAGCHQIVISGGERGTTAALDPAGYTCVLPGDGGLVYVISSDSMGRGSDELGWALLQTYIQTIKDVQPLPKKILFYNAGVKVLTAESGALEALRELQKKGVEILACGTCLDFFQLKTAIKIGHISNMYDIMNSMTEAAKVVSPF